MEKMKRVLGQSPLCLSAAVTLPAASSSAFLQRTTAIPQAETGGRDRSQGSLVDMVVHHPAQVPGTHRQACQPQTKTRRVHGSISNALLNSLPRVAQSATAEDRSNWGLLAPSLRHGKRAHLGGAVAARPRPHLRPQVGLDVVHLRSTHTDQLGS